MSFTAEYIPYRNTKRFSTLAVDYVEQENLLKPFYEYEPADSGLLRAIEDRKNFPYCRKELVALLNEQYKEVQLFPLVEKNINSLLHSNCFTICTAHQPNIFTGHLYFVYKILHVVKIANSLNEKYPGFHFVPVYYMGSEDADIEELGNVIIDGKKYEWNTKQTGAVGRMQVDKPFLELMDAMQAQLGVESSWRDIFPLLKASYKEGRTIEHATFEFVHSLFGKYGLVIFLPDSPAVKNLFSGIIKKEINEKFSKTSLNETIDQFPPKYKAQIAGRDINLFYLKGNIRERIEEKAGNFVVNNTAIEFTRAALIEDVDKHPERFSPNVVLRPLLQELVLPNVVFVGGGAELSYWLELKQVFNSAQIPYPLLVLRNSFMIIEKPVATLLKKLQINVAEIFNTERSLLKLAVEKSKVHPIQLPEIKLCVIKAYGEARARATEIDETLDKHVWALQHHALKKLEQLEKKMERAQLKKHTTQERQVNKIFQKLFPHNSLQERVDNIIPFVCRHGIEILDELLSASTTFEQQFCIITKK